MRIGFGANVLCAVARSRRHESASRFDVAFTRHDRPSYRGARDARRSIGTGQDLRPRHQRGPDLAQRARR